MYSVEKDIDAKKFKESKQQLRRNSIQELFDNYEFPACQQRPRPIISPDKTESQTDADELPMTSEVSDYDTKSASALSIGSFSDEKAKKPRKNFLDRFKSSHSFTVRTKKTSFL